MNRAHWLRRVTFLFVLLIAFSAVTLACPSSPLRVRAATSHVVADAPVLRLLRSTALATKLSVNRDAFAAQIAIAKPNVPKWTATDAAITETESGSIEITATDAAKKFSLIADVDTAPGLQYLIVAKVTGSIDIEARGVPSPSKDEDWERSTPTATGTLVVNVVAQTQVRLHLSGTGTATLRGLTMREVWHRQPGQLFSAEDATIRTYVRDDRRPKGTPGSQYQSRDREALLATGSSVYEWPLDPSLGARVLDFETIEVPRHADVASPPSEVRATVEVSKGGVWTEAYRFVLGGPNATYHWQRHQVALDHVEGIRLGTAPHASHDDQVRTSTIAWGRPVIRPAQRGSTQPDVVIITIDALRADRVGIYGSTANLTPNLDRLGSEGAVFLEARTAAPKTWESLTATAYATWPDLVGVRTSGDSVHRGSTSIADVFAEAGYLTARLGNVLLPPGHLGEVDIEEDDHNDPQALARLVEIMNQEHDRPIFAWLHLAATHYPYALDKEFLSSSPGMAEELTPDELFRVVKEGGPPEAIANITKRADIAVKQTDTLLGRVLLPMLARRDRPGGPAIVAIAADHGSHRGEQGIWFMHATMHRQVLHVPLIISWPGHLTPRRSDRLVRLIDVGPTLLDLAGINVAAMTTTIFTGQSLRPILEDHFMPRLMNRIVDLSDAGSARKHGVVVIEDDDHKAVAADNAEYVYVSSGLHVKVPELSLYAWRTDPEESRDVSAQAPLVAGELLSHVKGARATVKRNISPEAARLLRQAGYASPTDSNKED